MHVVERRGVARGTELTSANAHGKMVSLKIQHLCKVDQLNPTINMQYEFKMELIEK